MQKKEYTLRIDRTVTTTKIYVTTVRSLRILRKITGESQVRLMDQLVQAALAAELKSQSEPTDAIRASDKAS